jgi:hypothetical protein
MPTASDPQSARPTLTTQKQVRAAFWRMVSERKPPGVTRKRIPNYAGNGTMYNTDTRCAFADFVDQLSKEFLISSELAHRVTLS